MTLTVATSWIETAAAGGNDLRRGLIVPVILFVASIPTALLIGFNVGILYGIISFCILDIPVTSSVVVFYIIRMKRHILLQNEFNRQNKRGSGAAISRKMRERLASFVCPDSPLDAENQHEAVVLSIAGAPSDKIASTFGTSASDIENILRSYDRFTEEQTRAEDGGVDYRLTQKQALLFLQLMVMSTPRSLLCGDGLLWDKKSVRALFQASTNTVVSYKSVNTFLSDMSMVIPARATVSERCARSADFRNWIENEFNRIRLSALEHGASIFWIYTVSPVGRSDGTNAKGKKMTMLAAVDGKSNVSFGLYKGDGGFPDFINKLAQENSGKIFAVINENYAICKKAANIAADIYLSEAGGEINLPSNEPKD